MDKPEFQHSSEEPHSQDSPAPEPGQPVSESAGNEPEHHINAQDPNVRLPSEMGARPFRVVPADFRIPFFARDLLYLVIFYLATGALLTVLVGAAAMRVLHIS